MAGPTQDIVKKHAARHAACVLCMCAGLAIGASPSVADAQTPREGSRLGGGRTPPRPKETPEQAREREEREQKAREAEEKAGGAKKFAPPTPNPTRPAAQPAPAQPAASKPPVTQPAIAQPQPAEGAEQQPLTPGGLSGDMYTFSAFAEPVDLTQLVDMVQRDFNLQIIKTDAGLRGQTVVLSTPLTIPKEDVLRFLIMLLEQRDYTLVQDRSGILILQPRTQVVATVGRGELFTTRIIPTPGIRPSSLSSAIQGLTQAARGASTGATPAITFMDELGVIVINDAPRITRIVEDFIDEIVAERKEVKFRRIPVNNIAASSAKERILDLLGVSSASRTGSTAQAQQAQQAQAAQQGAGGGATLWGTLSSLPDRLIVDPSSNSLFFKGREDEKDQIAEYLELVDVTSTLISKWYPVGNATSEAVAKEGALQQLGPSTSFVSGDSTTGASALTPQRVPTNPAVQGQAGAQDVVGAGFVLYPDSGGFVYRGTPQQHQHVTALIEQLRELSKSEEVVYEFYKLRHGKSEDIAATLQDLISSTESARSSPLLGGGSSSRASSSRNRNTGSTANRTPEANKPPSGLAGENTVGELGTDNVFVTADEPNNQIVVKAPLKLQPQIKRLIDKLDLRRPQVYIEAMIVSIQDSSNFRLAVEAQQIIGQFAFNTNFGLGSLSQTSGGTTPTTTGGFTSRKVVETDLGGITAALIRSKDVPLVVTALQNDTKAKILAVPQLLVDDNVEAEVLSEDQQPTTTTTQSTGNPAQTSFGGFQSAGPRLTVTPQISEGGYLKLDYEITISNFVGDPVSAGVPPARQESTIRADSVTVPGDSTIVVGGLTQESNQDIVIKVPLLGDIPIIGTLFKDQRKNFRRTTFYVFITPKIMRDPTFADLRLLTQGPLKATGGTDSWPVPKAEAMEVADPRWGRQDQLLNPGAPEGTPVEGVPAPQAEPMEPGAAEPGVSEPVPVEPEAPTQPAPTQPAPTEPGPAASAAPAPGKPVTKPRDAAGKAPASAPNQSSNADRSPRPGETVRRARS